MDAIYGVTKEMLAELMSKYSELKAKLGERQGDAEFQRYLASRGLDMGTWARAHNAWLDRFRADPTGRSEAEFHMMLQKLTMKAHFGDVRDMSADTVEGITLDQYAQITVAVSRQGADVDGLVRQFGLGGAEHWQRANAAWSAKMGTDMNVATQFGQLYQKYAGPSFEKEMLDQTADILARKNQPEPEPAKAPDEPLTPDLCLRKMAGGNRKERWKYAGLYANMIDTNNVPDKAQAVAAVTPVLLEMIEQHDEHTTSDAERGVRSLWDIGVRSEDVRGATSRCLNRAKEKLTSLEAAFAPIRDKAVPERVFLQSAIQDHTSLVETMTDYASRSWSTSAAPKLTSVPAPVVLSTTRPSGGGVGLGTILLVVLVLGGGGAAAFRFLGGSHASSGAPSANAPAAPAAQPPPAKAAAGEPAATPPPPKASASAQPASAPAAKPAAEPAKKKK